MRWATLSLVPARFVSSDWHDSLSDLLFSVEREPDATPVLVYVLLEHQSSPNRWMPLRVLNYCVQVWVRWQETHEDEGRSPLIVPLVLYQGAQPWQHERELAALFADVAPKWRWVPRFEHVLIDQTRQSPDSVPGGLAARLAQVAMMAAFRQAREELLESATRLMGELYRAMGFDAVTKHVEYVLATQPDEYRSVFVDALRRNVPGRGGDVMNYVEQLIERGRREGRQEGRQEGRSPGRKAGRSPGRKAGRTDSNHRGIAGTGSFLADHRSGHRHRRGRLSEVQATTRRCGGRRHVEKPSRASPPL